MPLPKIRMNDVKQHTQTPLPTVNERIGSYYIQGYMKGAISQGHDVEEILTRANIPVSTYADPNATISGEQLQQLILTLRDLMNDHYMGFLHVPGKLAMDAESGRAAVKAGTLGEGLVNLCNFINAVRSDEERTLIIDEGTGEFSLICRFTELRPDADPHLLYWYRMYWGYRFYCWLIGQRIKATRVCFTGPKPEGAIDYHHVFHCAIEFDCPENSLSFDRGYLNAKTVRSEVELFNGGFLMRYPNWFTIPGQDQSLSNQVEQILLELDKDGMYSPSVSVVAGILSTTPRTLTRKLGKEKESFQRIKSRVRCGIARKLLQGSDLPITQIAYRVGYAEPGDFTRAFISWTGQTPSSCRAQRRT